MQRHEHVHNDRPWPCLFRDCGQLLVNRVSYEIHCRCRHGADFGWPAAPALELLSPSPNPVGDEKIATDDHVGMEMYCMYNNEHQERDPPPYLKVSYFVCICNTSCLGASVLAYIRMGFLYHLSTASLPFWPHCTRHFYITPVH